MSLTETLSGAIILKTQGEMGIAMHIYEGSKNFETFPTKNLHFSTPTLWP